jgi:hypothetical protein
MRLQGVLNAQAQGYSRHMDCLDKHAGIKSDLLPPEAAKRGDKQGLSRMPFKKPSAGSRFLSVYGLETVPTALALIIAHGNRIQF